MEKLQNLRFVIRDQTQWKKFSWEKVLDKIQQFSECTIPLSHFLVALLLSFCWQRFGIIWHSLIFIIPISFYFILSFINFKVARIFPKSFFFFSYHILFFFLFEFSRCICMGVTWHLGRMTMARSCFLSVVRCYGYCNDNYIGFLLYAMGKNDCFSSDKVLHNNLTEQFYKIFHLFI